MNVNMKNLKFLHLAVLLAVVLSFQSCDDSFYDSQLVGRWDCVSFRGNAIAAGDYHIYNNFTDHTGYMEAYDDHGNGVYYTYRWYTTDRRTIVFDWTDAYGMDPTEYYYSFDHGFLYLTDVFDDYYWWSYRTL